MVRFAMRRSRGLLLAVGVVVTGCSESPSQPVRDADVDALVDADTCAARAQAFTEFVAAHQSCSVDTDCAVIGDCGPNADFTAVRADVAFEARELQRARCGGAYDGPMYRPVCQAGTCALVTRVDTCCGCPNASNSHWEPVPVDGGACSTTFVRVLGPAAIDASVPDASDDGGTASCPCPTPVESAAEFQDAPCTEPAHCTYQGDFNQYLECQASDAGGSRFFFYVDL